MEKIDFTLVSLWVEFELQVVAADVPILLLIDDMDLLGVYFKKLTNQLVNHKSREFAVINCVKGQ